MPGYLPIRGEQHLSLLSKHQTWGLHLVPHCKQFGAESFLKHQNLQCLPSMEPADVRLCSYKGKVALKLDFKAPDLGPAFSSTLQIVWCRKFSETLIPSVFALYGHGRCPVMRLSGESSTQPSFQSTKLGACIQFHTAQSLVQKVF